jgi:hypothetical protein
MKKLENEEENNNINIKSREFYINKQIENHKKYYKINQTIFHLKSYL